MAIRENWKVNPVTGTKGWCLTMRCWESIRDDRLVDVNIVEIYTLSLVSRSLFAVENGDIWETPYGWCLCAGLFQGIDHTQENCLSESFGPGIDTVLRKEYLGKLDSIPGVPINNPSVFFSVWRVWRIQVNFNPVVSASTICARARDLLEVLVSFEMFRHTSVVHNEYWSDVDRVFEYHHFWLQISDKRTTSCLWIRYLVPSRRIQHHWLLPHSHGEAKEKFFHDAWNPSNVPRFQNHLGSSTPP